MPNTLAIIIVLVIAIPIVVILLAGGATSNAFIKLRSARVEPLPPLGEAWMQALSREWGAWAQGQGMDLVGLFLVRAVVPNVIVVWRCRHHHSYFCMYLVQNKRYFDFVSIIDEQRGATLTTSGTKDVFAVPRSTGSFAQSFHGAAPDELQSQHRRAMQYLMSIKRMRFSQGTMPFPQLLEVAIRQQVNEVCRIPLYWLRAAWWFFVTRNQMNGKTIEQQHAERLWQ